MVGNQTMAGNDRNDVDCIRWREALSAIADGEPPGIDARLVTAHVAGCPACYHYQRSIAPRVGAHELATDLPRKVSKLNAAADRARRSRVLRIALAVVAVQVIVFALPALVLGEEHDTATHAARHLGAFGVAYGVALLVVVFRPARARSILPVALVLAGAQVIAAVVDLASGRIPALGEARHVPQVVSVFLIWFVATPSTRGHGSRAKSRVAGPRLEIVKGDRRVG
jgi:predicted anti-sigma-YlaC factor YlaD